MKKLLFISLLTTLALCGCQKKELEYQPVGSIKFTATIEDDFGDTKTSLDGQGNVLWKKGNQVSIFNGSTINQQYQVTDASEGKTAAGLIPVSPAGFVAGGEIDNNVALYPYSSTAEIVKNEGAYVISGISLPATQNYAAGSFGDGAFPMTAVTSSVSDLNLKFKNILGCLKLQLKGTTSIASITVTGNNNEILCGAASVTAATGTVPSISLTDESAKTVTLNCGDGVALNTSTATPFVIALPPMTMTGGFTVIVRDTEGKEMEIKTTKSQTIIRSGILKMPEVNYEGTLKPFTITSSGSTSIAFCKEGEPDPITLQYRQGTEAWNAYTIGTIINLNDGESLQFRAGDGGNSTFSTNWDKQYYHIVASGEGTITASGNIMSLLDGNMTRSDVPSNGFTNLFYDCSKLTDASMLKLPATTLSENCYDNLFYGCTSLTQAPKLPATTLAKSCYFGMFRNCTSLTQAPELQATNLADQCYRSMFNSCTSLTQAPKLPATTLAENCYRAMFSGCLGLTIVPELPATTMASGSYISMFYGCLGLTIAPELPATTLAENCYQSMFEGCYSLTTAPNLPATTLASYCYAGMFNSCYSLTTAPNLPATTLAGYCYAGMFHGCRSLTKAPELPATTLEDGCYVDLFGGCSDLNYVKALFYTTPSDSYTKDWLSGVSSTGTFVKNYHATWDVTGTNGIPEGWTVEIDEDTKDYFTITSIGSTSVSISKVGTPNDITLEYRKGSGSWNAYTVGLGVDLSDGEMLQFRAGEGGNSTFSISNSKYYIVSIEGDGQVVVSGNIMSLLDKTLKKKDMPSYGFLRLFRDCEKITNAANLKLPATTLESSCYSNMFNGCTSLTQAPELPATTLANACYTSMFMGCTNLTQAPKLPATTLAISCYFGMFRGCTNLTQAPELPATTLVNGCYNNMFNGCTSLIQAPELPATTLANACYTNMFNGCTSLIQAPELPATVLKDNCYYNMFNGCSNLNYVKALFTTTPSDSYTKDWLAGVSSTGTFIKNGSATWDVTGVNGIPEGWTVEIDEDTKPYFTITSTGNTSVSISKVGTPNDITLEYRKGSGSWSAYTVGTGLDLSNKECLQFRAGEGGNDGFWKDSDKYYNVVIAGTGTVDVYGNIMSLLDNSLKTSSVPWHGFHNFFKGCTKLVSAYLLELPATTLANGCYSYMFSGCTSLTLAPELPAKIVPGYCYQYMFYGCTSLTKAPELPATSLGDDCYVEMFSGCTSLTTAPKLPATSLGYRCYQEMFKGCTSLTQAPAILATTLTDYCYSGMFLGCTALKQASELPATTLTSGCYSGMFNGCTSLTTTPELPATSLANYCYSGMFNGCTSLTTTPELPATTLAERCYSGMFDGCTSLTTAPELPATTLVDGCFCGMFQDCKKLNYVKALFTTTPSDTYTMSWLAGVSSTGIFVKSKDATWDVSGANGIPSGWTVQTE